jgi:hypothetical protein
VRHHRFSAVNITESSLLKKQKSVSFFVILFGRLNALLLQSAPFSHRISAPIAGAIASIEAFR